MFRKSRRALEAKQVFANFRLWVGLIAYCVINLLCLVTVFIWGSFYAMYYMAMSWAIALPAIAAITLLVLKLKSLKATFSWGAYAAAVVTLVVAGGVNLTFIVNVLAAE